MNYLPPTPFYPLPQLLPLYTDGTGDSNHWYDDSNYDIEAFWAAQAAAANAAKASGIYSAGGGALPNGLSVPSGALWLQTTGLTNAVLSVNLVNATDYVYEVCSTTDLSQTNWNIEAEVFSTNQQVMPFTVNQQGRPALFLWARDWTNITSYGNQTQEWWLYKYFGTVNLSDTNLDVNGINTLLYDFTNGINPTNITGLWLQIQGITNGVIALQMNNATDLVYEVTSSESLADPLTNWNIEQAVFPSSNQVATPFCVWQGDRTNSLFFYARDWTDVTSDGNVTPEWWFWMNYGTVNLSDTNIDSWGWYDLWTDYELGIDPNPAPVAFMLNVTNQYVNTENAAVQLMVTSGTPRCMAELLDSSNTSAAVWMPFNSNLVVDLGTVTGWHTVWVGVRGSAQGNEQSWDQIDLKLLLAPPVLVVTNPMSGTVTQPLIQLEGYCANNLASVSYDISNFSSFQTNQQAFLTSGTFDVNNVEYTTNCFACFNVPLTTGPNTITLHATDLAGNMSATNLVYIYDPTANTNPPVMTVSWPPNNASISGTNLCIRGSVSDPFASINAEVANSAGTNDVNGFVQQDGSWWIENVLIAGGTNYIAVAATNSAGYGTMSNIVICQSPISLTINSVNFDNPVGPTATVSGSLSGSDDTVVVNGVAATNNGDGNWTAYLIPVGMSGTAAITAEAIGNGSGNGGSGGGGSGNGGAMGAPDAATAMDVVRGSQLVMAECFWTYKSQETQRNPPSCGFPWGWSDSINNPLSFGYGKWGCNLYEACQWWYQFDTGNDFSCGTNYTYNLSTWGSTGNGEQLGSSNDECGEISFHPPVPDYATNYIPGFMENAVFSSSDAGGNWEYRDYQRYSLITGGQTAPGQQHIWVIWAREFPEYYDTNGTLCGGPPVPPAQITVAGQTLDTNGRAYLAIPSGSGPVDVTPQGGAPNYTFSIYPQEYIPQIQANGIPLDPVQTNATFCVGQQITFTLAFWPPPPYGSVPYSSMVCNWTLPAKFVNGLIPPTLGCSCSTNYTKDASLLTTANNTCTCWYVNGSGGTVSVGANLIMPNGVSISTAAMGKFAIYRPTFTVSNGPAPWVTNTTVDNTYALSLGNGARGDMEFQILVQTLYAGRAGIAQLINANRTSGTGPYSLTTTGGGFWLDTDFPYGNPLGFLVQSNNQVPIHFADGPYVALNPPMTTVYDQFEDYVIFAPTNANSIFVTLGTLGLPLSWSWNASSSFSTSSNIWLPAIWTVATPSMQDTKDAFPLWTNTFNP